MEHKNVFHKGITTDLDYMLRSPDTWDFPTLNIRVINKEGQGLVVTTMKGNEKFFEITDGFQVIGASEYNGIVYIVSCNDDTGMGEVGCYPSPTEWTETNTSFKRKYSAFYNFGEAGNIGPLRSTLFNMTTKNYADVFVRASYDDSVNLYITDFINPIRVVNSNFKQTGEVLSRYYTEESFDGAMNLIASTKEIPYGDNLVIENGGEMPPGNYYLFFRYLTEDYNSTHFIADYGVISVFDGVEARDISGSQYKDWLNNVLEKTNKKITFTINNLDPSYAYLQIGVLHYTATTENAAAIRDVYLINKSFPITSHSKIITILGTEAQTSLTYAELITPRIPYNINKSHIPAGNTYYGANWKKTPYGYDKEKMAEFAKKIDYTFIESDNLIGYDDWFAHQEGYSSVSSFKNIQNTLNRVSLLRGEIYSWAISFQFSDGTESEAYPLKGLVNGIPNEKGLIQAPFYDQYSTLFKSLGMEFNFATAKGYYDANESDFDGIIGYRLLRGERIDNFICQGMVLPCYQALRSAQYGNAGFNLGKVYHEDQNNYMPLYKGRLAAASSIDPDYNYYTAISINDPDSASATFVTLKADNRYGIFSPDLMLGNVKNIPSKTYVRRAFAVNSNDYNLSVANIRPNMIAVEVEAPTNIPHAIRLNSSSGMYYPSEIYEVDSVIVPKATRNGPSRFTSYMPGRAVYLNTPGALYQYNRSIATQSYIGITTPVDFDTIERESFNDIAFYVNLYKNNPTDTYYIDVVSSFDATVEIYQPASSLIPISTTGNKQVYKGDSFPTKSYFRTHRFNGYDYAKSRTTPASGFGGDGWEHVGDNDIWYQHGFGMGLFTENLLNVDMRNEVKAYDTLGDEILYSYFPKCLDFYESIQNWIALRDIPAALVEATQVNDGYNQVLSSKYYLGYDSNLPVISDNQRPGRIYHSSKNTPGSIVDSFRSIALSNKIDVDSENGAITRLLEYMDNLISIQEYGINQHPIKERVTQSDSSSGDIVLADNVNLLPTYFKKLAEFGSQHMSSIIKTPKAIYGVDWLNSVIWIMNSKATQSGKTVLSANDMLENKLLAKWFNDYKTQITSFNDIKSKLIDDPINGNGIVLGYNKKYNEVYFTFLYNDTIDVTGTTSTGGSGGSVDATPAPVVHTFNNTLVFNELINAFIGEASFTPYAYLGLRDDLYTLNSNASSDAFKHDSDNFLKFYDAKYPMKLSFVINARQGEKSLYDFEKIFQALKIEMSKEDLYTIIYETESQYGLYTFITKDTDTDNFWKHAEYLENEWRIPVVVQTTSKSKDYNAGSDMRGHWMKVTLEYNPTTEAQAIYIKKVISKFLISKS